MRRFRLLLGSLALMLSPLLIAAEKPDSILLQGLQTCIANGVDAGVRSWYVDRPSLAVEMSNKVLAAANTLGDVVDTEVVVIQPVSKRVVRYYVAIYFERGPLWIRIERYDNGEKSRFLPLRCSTQADEVLPGYITEFQR